MFSKKIFGERLKTLRKQNHETQTQLAALLGVKQAQISGLEVGRYSTTIENLVTICEHYNVSPDYLLGFSEEP